MKNHDVHHRLPESNYGQYIMLWDYLMGSYRPYAEKYAGQTKEDTGLDDDGCGAPVSEPAKAAVATPNRRQSSRLAASAAKKTK